MEKFFESAIEIDVPHVYNLVSMIVRDGRDVEALCHEVLVSVTESFLTYKDLVGSYEQDDLIENSAKPLDLEDAVSDEVWLFNEVAEKIIEVCGE